MMNPVSWLQMTNMISYQGLVRTFLNHYQQANRCQNIFKHDVYSYSALKNRSVLKNPAQLQHKLLDGIGLTTLQLTMATDRAFTDPVQPPDHAI